MMRAESKEEEEEEEEEDKGGHSQRIVARKREKHVGYCHFCTIISFLTCMVALMSCMSLFWPNRIERFSGLKQQQEQTLFNDLRRRIKKGTKKYTGDSEARWLIFLCNTCYLL